jgi:hypothetical protein
MTVEFDIHQPVVDEYGEFDEDAALRYRDELMSRFADSPEAQDVVAATDGIGWSDTFMSYAMGYLGVTPPEMTVNDVDEVLFELFPAKVSAGPGAGREIVTELRAFWAFLLRVFQLDNADSILALLRRTSAQELERDLQDPGNFGMAKSFFMLGQQAGFDMTTEQGTQEFAAVYNAALASNPLPPLPASPYSLAPPIDAPHRKSSHAAKNAVHRKMAKASRKKNRKK